jgi:hypothetical protein
LRIGPAFSSGDWQGTLLVELWIAMIGTANVVISGKAKEAGAARAIAHRMFHDMDMAFWLGQVDD